MLAGTSDVEQNDHHSSPQPSLRGKRRRRSDPGTPQESPAASHETPRTKRRRKYRFYSRRRRYRTSLERLQEDEDSDDDARMTSQQDLVRARNRQSHAK